ncbi:hypothetical protein, partial [Enterobacter roggenkampii]|uniref:hypothetical protein n=1 Tax=Enterobacter roggenkampii TaxID=1812935 RepID=UPI00292B0DD7
GSFGPYGCPENLSVRFFPNSAGSPLELLTNMRNEEHTKYWEVCPSCEGKMDPEENQGHEGYCATCWLDNPDWW